MSITAPYSLDHLDSPQSIATILHGAYGDYFEQLLCIADLASRYPQHSYLIFHANHYRMKEFNKLRYDFATVVDSVDTIAEHQIDHFYQFQVLDSELQEDVIAKLPPALRALIDTQNNLLPHIYMHTCQERKSKRFDMPYSEAGEQALIAMQSALPDDFFSNKTIGFMWRYRNKGGAVKPFLMPSAESLRLKYSNVLSQAIEKWDCKVLVAGMKVKTTEKNRLYVDAKFPEYGLELDHSNIQYLPGKGWLTEVDLLSRCDIVICNPSGFSEAIFLKGKECLVVDPPLHYVLKTVKNGFPLFDIGIHSGKELSCLARCIFQRHSEQYLLSTIDSHFAQHD